MFYLHVYVPRVCLVSTEGERRCQIFWIWSYRWLCSHHIGVRTQTGPLEEHPVLLFTNHFSQPKIKFKTNYVCVCVCLCGYAYMWYVGEVPSETRDIMPWNWGNDELLDAGTRNQTLVLSKSSIHFNWWDISPALDSCFVCLFFNVSFFVLSFIFVFWSMVSCSAGWLLTHCASEVILELLIPSARIVSTHRHIWLSR